MNESRELRPGDLLPWYVNGTLSRRERAAVERELLHSEVARLELSFWRRVSSEVTQDTKTDEHGVELGWKRLRRQLRTRTSTARVPASWWRAAVAAVVAVTICVQTVMLYRIESESVDRDEIRQLAAASDNVRANEWHIQVRFRATAAAGDIQKLLQEIDGRIVDGPSALGLYELAVSKSVRFADASALASWLSMQPIVEQGTAPP